MSMVSAWESHELATQELRIVNAWSDPDNRSWWTYQCTRCGEEFDALRDVHKKNPHSYSTCLMNLNARLVKLERQLNAR